MVTTATIAYVYKSIIYDKHSMPATCFGHSYGHL